MITISEYKNQNVGVFGLGKAGTATVSALMESGAKVWAWDDNQAAALGKNVAGLCAIPYTQWPWSQMKCVVLSPGIAFTHRPHAVVPLARNNNCPIVGDIELLYRACPGARYVGITGTNGKSTTTTLVGHILKSCGVTAEVGGNLGTPALALSPLGKEGVYALELSSYQLDLVRSARFNIAVWLNISPDHIDRHGSLENYIEAKKRVFDRQQAGDAAIIGVDDDYSRNAASALKAKKQQRVIEISVRSKVAGGVFVENGILHDTMDMAAQQFDLNPIATLTGKHNWQNAAAAYAAARALGLEPNAIYHAMLTFEGLRHRLQLAATINGVRFINDSKATNADATGNALAPYETIYWIAGGRPKEGGIAALAPYFLKIAHAFLIGEAEEEFASTLEGKAPCTRCGTLEVAVRKAAEMAFKEGKPGAVVLLSPACASFDQFKNFEERGDAFCALVETLSAGNKGNKRHAS